MFVSIHRQRDGVALVPGDEHPRLTPAPIPLDDVLLHNHKRFRLQAGEIYWLRLYAATPDDAVDWKPVHNPNLTVLEYSRRPAEAGTEPEVNPTGIRLAARIRFEAYNDGALCKLIRWQFASADADRDRDAETYTTIQLPIEVDPSPARRRYIMLWVLISVSAVSWLSAIGESLANDNVWVATGFWAAVSVILYVVGTFTMQWIKPD